MKTKIIIGQLKSYCRSQLEAIDGDTFENEQMVFEAVGGHIGIYSLSDFVDLCNNEELNLDSVWLACVQIGNKDVDGTKKQIGGAE